MNRGKTGKTVALERARRRRNAALCSSARADWPTSQFFAELLWQFGDVGLDPCSNSRSIVSARREYFKRDNGLARAWIGYGLVYVNPPYGRAIPAWMEACRRWASQGVEIIALVPARVDTAWYQDARPDADVELRGRLTFLGAPHPALFPSSVLYWGKRVERFAQVFGGGGRLHIRASEGSYRDPFPSLSEGVPAALYHRVSTVDQDPAGAQEELRRAATARGLVVALEEQETGSGARGDRPGLERVMAAAAAGKVRAIVVWKLDRFGRSTLDVLARLQELERVGCRFIVATQGIDIAGAGAPMDRLILQTLAAVAEFERTLIAERTKNGLANAVKRGVQLGRPRTVEVDAQRVLELRRQEKPWREIATELGCSLGAATRAAAAASKEAVN